MPCNVSNNLMNNSSTPPYLNEELSFEERAADLVSRMTLEEKAAQLKNISAAIPRLGVSAYDYWREALHGVARQGKATSFPTSIAMANTWNRELVYRCADITSTEARGKDPRLNLSYWSPTINMARDPRWGRNEETYGEDPYLTSVLGGAFVRGFQGTDEKYIKAIACLKHFAANNVEKERRGGSSMMNENTLREYYTRAFKSITETENPRSVMGAYNALTVYRCGELLFDYVPSTANSYLLIDLLRRDWGFDGYITGDCGAFDDFWKVPAYKTTLFPGEDISEVPQYATITKGFLNGADSDCGSAANTKSVLDAVEKGYITEDELSRNVYHLFLQRMRTGEFDKDTEYSEITPSVLETAEHIEAAEEAAEQSWVLLKNDGILPLGANKNNIGNNIKKIAVVGALANEIVLGDYSGSPEVTVTPLDGIRGEFPEAEVQSIGGVTSDTVLMDISAVTLVKRGGDEVRVDISEAGLNSVTTETRTVIPSVNFEDVVSVRVSYERRSGFTCSVRLFYGVGGPQVSEVRIPAAMSGTVAGEYTGAAGGYAKVADMVIGFTAEAGEFSVDRYRAELDAADVIIAYGGTTLSDSAEFFDRADVSLPQSQAHVNVVAQEYPEKTVVALQTVGQVDVNSFKDKARAILWTSYNGQMQGRALARVLSGAVVPSGRLTSTWYRPEDLEKMPIATETVTGGDGIVRYRNDYEIKPRENFPGRTYQYYGCCGENPVYPFGFGLSYTEFKYSNMSVSRDKLDANDILEVSLDVTNVGSFAAYETVQFYVAFPGGGKTCPKKQLKGFEKIYLSSGETRHIAVKIPVPELWLYSEEARRMYVKNGEYTVYAAKSSADEGVCARFSVTGTLKSELKTASVVPSGLILHGLITEDGSEMTRLDSINANPSAIMSDSYVHNILPDEIRFESDNSDIAEVNENGTVVSGEVSGVTTIRVYITVGGITKSAAFPVVNVMKRKASLSDIEDAKAAIKAELDACERKAYSDGNYEKLMKSANTDDFDEIAVYDDLEGRLETVLAEIRSVKPDMLDERYKIVCPEKMKNGVISEEGVMRLIALDGESVVSNENLKWQVKPLGGARRTIADIDGESGELTVVSNGLIRVRAVNIDGFALGEALIYINLPLKAKNADAGADGGAAWTEFKGVRLENLKSIRLEYSLPSGKATLDVSLGKSSHPSLLVASEIVCANEQDAECGVAELCADPSVLCEASDENGLGALYIQTNEARLDTAYLIYEEIDDEIPYRICAVNSAEDGAVEVVVRYVGSSQDGAKVCGAALYASDTCVEVCGGGRYRMPLKAKDGERISICIKDKRNAVMAEAELVYKTPPQHKTVVYSADDPAYSIMFRDEEGGKLPEVNGLTGYGAARQRFPKFDYTYGGKTYHFTSAWRLDYGNEQNRCLFFLPKAPCIVTALFSNSEGREMYLVQDSVRLASARTVHNKLAAVSRKITDTSKPVYIYGSRNLRFVSAVIVEYLEDVTFEREAIQTIRTSSGYAMLYTDTKSGRTGVAVSATGGVWSDLDISTFAASDISPVPENIEINAIAHHKGRIYAACGGGLLLILSGCPKCGKLLKAADFDIISCEADGDRLHLIGDGVEKYLTFARLGADSISLDEALISESGGAVVIDVRDGYTDDDLPFKNAVRMSLDELWRLNEYGKDETLIFCCDNGVRSFETVLRAKEMGYTNTYSLGLK